MTLSKQEAWAEYTDKMSTCFRIVWDLSLVDPDMSESDVDRIFKSMKSDPVQEAATARRNVEAAVIHHYLQEHHTTKAAVRRLNSAAADLWDAIVEYFRGMVFRNRHKQETDK